MTDDRFGRLTERQREALRLVAVGRTMKEVAIALNSTEAAIRERLRAARDTLGTNESRIAARQLIEWEAQKTAGTMMPQSLPSEHVGGVTFSYIRGVDGSNSVETGAFPTAMSMGSPPTDRAADRADRPPATLLSLLFPAIERPANDLTSTSRNLIILIMALLALAIAAGGVVTISHLDAYMAQIGAHGG